MKLSFKVRGKAYTYKKLTVRIGAYVYRAKPHKYKKGTIGPTKVG